MRVKTHSDGLHEKYVYGNGQITSVSLLCSCQEPIRSISYLSVQHESSKPKINVLPSAAFIRLAIDMQINAGGFCERSGGQQVKRLLICNQ